MRAVILSGLRGEGRLLHLDSPFVDAEDRPIAEYLIAEDELPSRVLDAIEAVDPGKQIRDGVRDIEASPELHDKIRDLLKRRAKDPNRSPEEPEGPAR